MGFIKDIFIYIIENIIAMGVIAKAVFIYMIKIGVITIVLGLIHKILYSIYNKKNYEKNEEKEIDVYRFSDNFDDEITVKRKRIDKFFACILGLIISAFLIKHGISIFLEAKYRFSIPIHRNYFYFIWTYIRFKIYTGLITCHAPFIIPIIVILFKSFTKFDLDEMDFGGCVLIVPIFPIIAFKYIPELAILAVFLTK